jgi:hypothetical protein
MARGAITGAALLVLAGCAGGEQALWRNESSKPTVDVAPTQTLDVPVDTARQQAAAWLTARGFAVREAPGGLRAERATSADPAWSICPNPRVSSYDDDSNQSRPAVLTARQATVTVDLTSAGEGSRAAVSVDDSAVMLNTFKSTTFDVACRSTGFLERDLFAAMRAG